MTAAERSLEVRHVDLGKQRVAYRLHRSARRTLEIAVLAGGIVEVRAPRDLEVATVEGRLRARAGWLRRKVEDRSLHHLEGAPRTYVSGETHRYLGRQYRLSVKAADCSHVRLQGGRLLVEVPEPKDPAQVRSVVATWLRDRANVVIRARLENLTVQPAFEGLRPSAVTLRTMRNRWGSCSAGGRLLLNTGLVALPVSLIDYVLAHELCHLRVPKHDARFERLLARVMPDWRARHRRLQAVTFDETATMSRRGAE